MHNFKPVTSNQLIGVFDDVEVFRVQPRDLLKVGWSVATNILPILTGIIFSSMKNHKLGRQTYPRS